MVESARWPVDAWKPWSQRRIAALAVTWGVLAAFGCSKQQDTPSVVETGPAAAAAASGTDATGVR